MLHICIHNTHFFAEKKNLSCLYVKSSTGQKPAEIFMAVIYLKNDVKKSISKILFQFQLVCIYFGVVSLHIIYVMNVT